MMMMLMTMIQMRMTTTVDDDAMMGGLGRAFSANRSPAVPSPSPRLGDAFLEGLGRSQE